jgi:hypothetical protein
MENTSAVAAGLVDSISDIGEDMMVTDPSPGDAVSENVVDSAQTSVPLLMKILEKRHMKRKRGGGLPQFGMTLIMW